MLHEFTAQLGNLLLSLSDAIDMADARIASHQMRTAFVAWKLAEAANLPNSEVERIFLAAIFHDIGALSIEEKAKLHEGFKNVHVDVHCILGAELFSMCPLTKSATPIVRHHHRPWTDWNEPVSNLDVLGAQIVYLADILERSIRRDQYILHQADHLRAEIASLSGLEVHPDVVDLLMDVSRYEDFWFDLVSHRLYSLLLHYGPFRHTEVDQKDIFPVASIFRHVIDFKSRFTATHSTGVAECAALLCRFFGFTDLEVTQMRIAGYFHDLGKLAIPNSILEKPGRLTKEEFEIVKQHTYFTYTILSSIGGLEQIAEWAAFHHEKLDGSGYPFHVDMEKISIGARIMTVADIFTALFEDRPYREGLSQKKIADILQSQVASNHLDRFVVQVLLDNFAEISAEVKEKQRESIDLFDAKFWKLKAEDVRSSRPAKDVVPPRGPTTVSLPAPRNTVQQPA